jgi:hypothetical protein
MDRKELPEMEVWGGEESESPVVKIGTEVELEEGGKIKKYSVLDIVNPHSKDPEVILVSVENLGDRDTSQHLVENIRMKMSEVHERLKATA